MKYSDRARVFLAGHDMEPESVELEGATAAFLSDMHLGLAGRDSSLKMIPTYLTAQGDLPYIRPAAVIDAGGTNFRTALVTFTREGPVTDCLEISPMPGSESPVSYDEFIFQTARRLAPLMAMTDTIGFCFSYPTRITENRDGDIINLTKQIRIDGFQGHMLCADLREELAARGLPGRKAILLNDTPAVLLSGACLLKGRQGAYDGLIGLISGTGTNTCCDLPVTSIRKLGRSDDGSMLVNLESGGFANLPRGDYDRELDSATMDPGAYRHEKMTSGAYLGELCLLILRGAASEGLFSPGGAKAMLSLGRLHTPDADAIAARSVGRWLLTEEKDMALASELCRSVFDRAARCVCANLSAILTLTERGSDPDRPACVCVDGSLFRKGRVFRPALEGYMNSFTAARLGRRCVFGAAENATVLGAAAAALLNN